MFPGVACAVTESHSIIACNTSACMGGALTWRVVVEAQSNAVPLSSVAPPVVASAWFFPNSVTTADTKGGTLLRVAGVNFGPFVNKTQVRVAVPGRELAAENCTLVAPDTLLECGLPPGTGAITGVVVTVLGQGAGLALSGLAYTPPSVTSFAPGNWSTDLTATSVAVVGSGFGSSTLSSQVQIMAVGRVTCSNSSSEQVEVQAHVVTVRNDGSLAFELRSAVPHVVSRWLLTITVAGQALGSGAIEVDTRPPSITALTFDKPPNGTHFFLLVTGSDFGPSVSTCLADVAVRINGLPCAQLTMSQVCTTRRGVWVTGHMQDAAGVA